MKWLEIDWQFANRNCYRLLRVSWALAQISCYCCYYYCDCLWLQSAAWRSCRDDGNVSVMMWLVSVNSATANQRQQPGAASRPAAGKPPAQPMRSQNNNAVGGSGDICNASGDAGRTEELEQQVHYIISTCAVLCCFVAKWLLINMPVTQGALLQVLFAFFEAWMCSVSSKWIEYCLCYLRQGGNVFASFCLFVCLSVSQQDNSKSYGRIFLKFWGYVGHGTNYQWFNFWGWSGRNPGFWITLKFLLPLH